MRKFLITGILAVSAAAIGQVDPAKTIAIINGEEIKGAEYYHRMEYLPGVGKVAGRVITEFPPGFLTLEQLITERLVLQLAKQKGVLPTDLEVASELKFRMEQSLKLMENWLASGRTAADLNHQIKYEMAQFKLATFGVTITDQQVEKHYKENPAEFRTPKQYKLRVVVVDSAEAKKAVETELASGKDFVAVVKAHSVDVGRETGGDMGYVMESAFQDKMKNAIAGTKIGQVSPWLETPNAAGGSNFVRFKVEDIKAESMTPLSPALKINLRRRLMLDAARIKGVDVEKEMRDMRAKARIDIRQPGFAEAYKEYIDAYLKQKG